MQLLQIKNKTSFFRTNPFLIILFPLIFGILIGLYSSWSASLVLLFAILLLLFILPTHQPRLRLLWAICLCLLWGGIGTWTVKNTIQQTKPPSNISKHYVKAIVRGVPLKKNTKLLVPLEIVDISSITNLKNPFFVLGYVPLNKDNENWRYGDSIYTLLEFTKIEHNTNPCAFDFAQLMSNRQIYYNGFSKDNPIIHREATNFSLIRTAQQTQKNLTERLDKYVPNKKVSNFLQAMTLGDRKHLSPTIKIDFANTGVIHILAVSGLHVGILFIIINLLLSPFSTSRPRRILATLLGLFIIWGFAFISGLSISVIRASIMFSGFQISILSLRPYKTYNTIAYSAIFLLLYNPFNLLEVGFQLSYIAVLGIVTINPILNKRAFKNKILYKLQQLITVSLSAQISVIPLSLYYFHQLPSYFLLANIIILIFAPILLGGTLFLLFVSFSPLFANIIGQSLSWLGKFCLTIINKIANLPNPIFIEYSPSLTEVFLWYLILIYTYLYYKERRYQSWYKILFFLLFSFSIWGYNQRKYGFQKTFIVHDIYKTSCYSFLLGNTAFILHTDSLSEFTKSSILKPLFIKRQLKNIVVADKNKSSIRSKGILFDRNEYFIGNKHIVIASDVSNALIPSTKIAIDYLIFSKQYMQLDILKYYAPKKIILDSSLSYFQSKELKKKLLKEKLPIHDIAVKGAFEREFFY